jgi:addiction module HigA family antidote
MARLSMSTSSTFIEGSSTMRMKDPPHPGELIGDSIEELGLSISEAARGLGITRQQLHNVIAGRSAVSPEMAVRFEKAFGSTADAWLRMQSNYDLAQIRERAGSIRVKRFAPKVA